MVNKQHGIFQAFTSSVFPLSGRPSLPFFRQHYHHYSTCQSHIHPLEVQHITYPSWDHSKFLRYNWFLPLCVRGMWLVLFLHHFHWLPSILISVSPWLVCALKASDPWFLTSFKYYKRYISRYSWLIEGTQQIFVEWVYCMIIGSYSFPCLTRLAQVWKNGASHYYWTTKCVYFASATMVLEGTLFV